MNNTLILSFLYGNLSQLNYQNAIDADLQHLVSETEVLFGCLKSAWNVDILEVSVLPTMFKIPTFLVVLFYENRK